MNDETRKTEKKNPLKKPNKAPTRKAPQMAKKEKAPIRSERTAITTEQSTLTEAIERSISPSSSTRVTPSPSEPIVAISCISSEKLRGERKIPLVAIAKKTTITISVINTGIKPRSTRSNCLIVWRGRYDGTSTEPAERGCSL